MPHPDLTELRERVDAALTAGDVPGALAILRPAARAVAAEEGSAFRELVGRLPAEAWHDDVVIASAMGVSYRGAEGHRGSAAIGYFEAAEALVAGRGPDADADRVTVWLAYAAGLRILGRLDDAHAYVERAMTLDGSEVLSVPVRVGLGARSALEFGMLELHLGRFDSGRRHLEFAAGLAPEHLTRAEHLECLGGLAIASYSEAELDAATGLVEQARAIAGDTPLWRSTFAAPALIAEAFIAIDRHEVDAAAALEAELVPAVAGSDFEALAHVVSGYLRLARREYPDALDHLHRARQGFRSWQPAGLGLDIAQMLRGAILVSLDQGEEAWSILRELPPHEHHLLCPARVVAQLRLGHGDLAGAAEVLRECEALGDAHAPRTLVEVRMLRAAIELERGDLMLSDSMMDRSLVTVTRTGTRAPLRMIPPGTLGALARRALQRPQSAATRDLLERVLERTRDVDRLIEPLSARELLVLAEVEKGSTVAAIAAALYISTNTVKTHLRRLYRKLGVTTRADAIRKARSLGLGPRITR